MLIVMANNATRDQVDRVVKVIEEMGYTARPMPGEQRTAIGLVGNDGRVDSSRIDSLPAAAPSARRARLRTEAAYAPIGR